MTTDTPARDGATVRFPPPFVPLIALALGVVLQRFVWPLLLPIAGVPRFAVGGLGVVLGIGVMAAALGLFRRTGQDPKPWLATPEIISTGIYARTRNPMYLGMALLQAGIAVLLANGWVLALVPVTALVIQRIAIRHEEAYLEKKFGSAYLDYKNAVRRWL